MTGDLILDRVQSIVLSIAGPDQIDSDAGPDTPLGDDGFWLDSVSVLEVILACEQEFGKIFDEESGPTADVLRTPRTLADAIRRKMR